MNMFPARPWRQGVLAASLLAFAGVFSPTFAADWYVAPIGTATALKPIGSKDDPFGSVDAAIQSGKIKGGDRILLKSGTHGFLLLRNVRFDSPVIIQSMVGKEAHLDGIFVRDLGKNITFKDLTVWPTDPSKVPDYPRHIVHATGTTSDIVVDGLMVKSERNAEQHRSWTIEKWNTRSFGGITLFGSHSKVANSRVIATGFPITVSGDRSEIINNVVDGFVGDGLRGIGDYTTIRGNKVYDCFKIGDNHDDGFQSWAKPSGVIKGLVIQENTIIEWRGPGVNALPCSLQGIGLFDGFYEDLVVTNNLVSTKDYHGITVLGARRATIINNTLVNGLGHTSTSPYVYVGDHKNGTPSTDVLVANNLAMSFIGATDPLRRIEFRNNSIIGTPGAVFENAAALDYRPKLTSGFIDTADPRSAPATDILGQPRPSGKGPDRGAYEVLASGGVTNPSAPPVGGAETPAANPAPPKPVVPKPPGRMIGTWIYRVFGIRITNSLGAWRRIRF